jgi:uncharacterized protein YcbK (DUF882 family)
MPGYNKLSTQLKLAWSEMKSYKMVDNMQRASSPESAAVVFEKLFERAGVKRLGIRKSEARETYNEFMKEYRAILAEHGVDSDSQSGRTTAKAAPKVHLAPKKSFDIVSILDGTTSSTPAETASNTNTIVSAVLAEQPEITLTPKPAIKPHELESVRQTLDVLLGVDTASASAASPEASGTDPMLPSTAEKNDDEAAHGAAHDHLSALVLQDVLAKPGESPASSPETAPSATPATSSAATPGIVLGDPSPSQSNEAAPDAASLQPEQSQGLDASSIVSSPDTTSTQPASATPIALTIPDQQAKPITLDAAPVTQEAKPVVLDVAPATDSQPITLTANGATATPIPETAPADNAPATPAAEQPAAKAPEAKKAEAPKPAAAETQKSKEAAPFTLEKCGVTKPKWGSQHGKGDEYSQKQLKKIFGDPGSMSNHEKMADKMVAVDFMGHKVKVHPKVAPCLNEVSKELEAKHIKYDIKQIGGYRYDSDNGSSNIGKKSYHTYGAAIDINWADNPWSGDGSAKDHDIPKAIIDIFKKNGFTWGGNWVSVKDYMHFEFNGIRP